MKIKGLTEASILTALFIVISMLAISTGIGYSLYLDMIAPILVVLIYFRCGVKYSIMSSLVSVIIISLVMGDIVTGIWLVQGMILGYICAFIINKNSSIADDILLISMFGCVIIVFVDIYFSKLTGYSFIKEIQGYATTFSFVPDTMQDLSKKIAEMVLYMTVSLFSFASVFIIYVGALKLGSKLNILPAEVKKKDKLMKNAKYINPAICLSKTIVTITLPIIILTELMTMSGVTITQPYIKTTLMSMKYIALFAGAIDSFKIVVNYIREKSKKEPGLKFIPLVILFLLFTQFEVVSMVLIITVYAADMKYNIRAKYKAIVDNFVNS